MVVPSELSPGSSSSSSTHLYAYDVFLSFRGADTRRSFTKHLYHALVNANIITFLDGKEIEVGDRLKSEVKSAIKSSRASIVVLSQIYASSAWCLDELVLILEQHKNFNQFVLPIFYDVEPTDVRKQQNSFGEAMATKHKEMMERETDVEKKSKWGHRMESWKRALAEVANLSGMVLDGRKRTRFINEVVTNIHRSVKSYTLPFLMGMDDNIKFIGSWLIDGSNHTADTLSIVGMGGIGKTSLARYVFQVYYREFEKSSFIEGIDRRCNKHFNGLRDLQMQLHRNISKSVPLQVDDAFVYTSKIENALARKRVFIVLDDIGSLDQLDALLGKQGLHPGSKIIITTTDASLTERCALFKAQVHPNRKEVSLNGLNDSQSLGLLCFHAFKSRNPEKGYEDVAQELVKYCEGHPLALEVLGTSLHKQDVEHWEEHIEVLKKEPHARINSALKLSFDSLSFKNDKELFKHIACFFVGIDRDVTQTILNACDIKTKSGITRLINRCLLHIGSNNELTMHQLIQKMGRDLIHQESPDKPWKRSRLWCHEESLKVLKQKKGTSNLLGIALDMSKLDKNKLHGPLELKRESFCHMDNLKLLQLNYVQLNDCFESFQELRWLCMHGFPLKSLQLDIQMENLVALDMSDSNIESFDVSYIKPQSHAKRQKVNGSCLKDKRLLGSLKILDLSFCKRLHSVGGFFELPVLERLIVRNCISLVEVCESIEECGELIFFDMSYCYNLKKLPPSLGKLKKFKTLLLDGCNSPESQTKTQTQDMNSSDLSINSPGSSSTLPTDLKFFGILFSCSFITRLSLANNNLFNESFPANFSYLSKLEELCLDNNPIVSMPDCVRTLPRLEQLSMQNCETMVSIEQPPRTLRELSVFVNPDRGFKRDFKTCLRKINFDPEMSPLNLIGVESLFIHPSFEIDGIIKIQALADVEEKVLHSLGWTSLEFILGKHLRISGVSHESTQTQMYYEFGIFSTIYEQRMMPDWISDWRKGSSISFTIPSSPNNLRGLNFYCTVETTLNLSFDLPLIKISNFTKTLTWVYDHCIDRVEFGGKCVSLLSHWVFGPKEMTGGDQITITVATRDYEEQVASKCGIGFVYAEDGEIKEEEKEEDVLGYYKSWNHIIGGDLSAFQLTTGEYILHNKQFWRFSHVNDFDYTPFIYPETGYKEERVVFKAFSKKCGPTSHVVIEEVE